MPLRKTTIIDHFCISFVEDFFTANSEIWSSESEILSPLKSFGETQGILPIQNSGLSFDGVPHVFVCTRSLRTPFSNVDSDLSFSQKITEGSNLFHSNAPRLTVIIRFSQSGPTEKQMDFFWSYGIVRRFTEDRSHIFVLFHQYRSSQLLPWRLDNLVLVFIPTCGGRGSMTSLLHHSSGMHLVEVILQHGAHSDRGDNRGHTGGMSL